jgi:hypothetical protein
MKRYRVFSVGLKGFTAACVVALASPAATPAPHTADALLEGFQTPPPSARPRVWWHWMNGNVTQEGIRLDLEWMRRVGIGGFQNFDAALGTPQVVQQRLAYMTPQWQEAFRFAVDSAEREGLEMAIASSPGWSETGGPWVTPELAMKKLVWSETELRGGRPFSGVLPKPPNTTGPYQNAPTTERTEHPERPLPQYYADSLVVAYPVVGDSHKPSDRTPGVSIAGKPVDASCLIMARLSALLRCRSRYRLASTSSNRHGSFRGSKRAMMGKCIPRSLIYPPG